MRQALARWSMADPWPLVLLIDEIDALAGDTLLSVLRQLRTGFDQRPTAFPHSVVLCGVRDHREAPPGAGTVRVTVWARDPAVRRADLTCFDRR